jgi:GxxExxY protein
VFHDVYNELGKGFLKSVYEASMIVALRQEGIDTVRQVTIPVRFRGHDVANARKEIRVNPHKSVAEVSA